MEVFINLPWPPSVNHYLGRNGRGSYLSAKARDYRSQVRSMIDFTYEDNPVALGIKMYPPDNRRRDLDNYFKQLFDALQYAGAIEDDCQVKKISAEMCQKTKGGLVTVLFSLY